MKKRTLKSKILSSVLALCMVAGLLPLAAFAEDTQHTDNKTITAVTPLEEAVANQSIEVNGTPTVPDFLNVTVTSTAADGSETAAPQDIAATWQIADGQTLAAAGNVHYTASLAAGSPALAEGVILPQITVTVTDPSTEPPTEETPTERTILSVEAPEPIEIIQGAEMTQPTLPEVLTATIADEAETTDVPVTWAIKNDTTFSTESTASFYYTATLAPDSGFVLGADVALPEQVVLVNPAEGEPAGAPQLVAVTGAESFSFQVTVADDGDAATTDDLSFSIPLSGASGTNTDSYNNYSKPYNWSIHWGDSPTSEVWYNGVANPAPGSAHLGNRNGENSAGITHTYPAGDTYTITITNNATNAVDGTANNEAWLAAFGFSNNANGANSATNKAKVTAILSGFTPLMTRTQAQITSATPQMHYEWADAFLGCTNLTGIGPGFSSGWDSVTTIQDYFAYNMFSGCTSLTSMSDSFNMPQSAALETIGDSFASHMFRGCTSLESMGNSFNMPQSAALETIEDSFASNMFSGCTSLESMGNRFNMPQSAALETIGDNFAYSMLSGCTSLESIGSSFNMPQSAALETIGDDFAYNMFNDCKKLKTMGNHFTLPQGGALTKIGNHFARLMFSGCIGLESMGSNFNLPQSAVLKEIGDHFAQQMFNGCTSLESMGSSFTLPQSPALTSIGTEFAAAMFDGCIGLESMGSNFNLPQSAVLEEIGNYFANQMFLKCTSLKSMGNSFNLPQGGALTTIGDGFAQKMFAKAGDNLVINDVFRFPKVAQVQLNQPDVFLDVFENAGLAANQSRTATSIINGNNVPPDKRNTFTGMSSAFVDYDFIATNWSGEATPRTVGATLTFDTDTIRGISVTGKPDPRPTTHGGLVTRPNNPSADGYTFENWYADENFTTVYDFASPVNADTTVYARWNCTVTFDSRGGSAVAPQTILQANRASEPSAPTKAGIDFAGWYIDSGLTTPYSFSTAVSENITLYAGWGYEVAFESSGGSAVATQKVLEGKTATMPSAPTKGGMYFAGWYTDSSLTTPYNFSTAVSENITLYARWGNAPTIINGRDQTITRGQSASFTSNDDFDGYVDTLVTLSDGTKQTVHIAGTTNQNASAVEGSIVLTLSGTYTATLPLGTHTISINSRGGSATASFTVVAAGVTSALSPQTGVY